MNEDNTGLFVLPQLDQNEPLSAKNQRTNIGLNVTTATGVVPMNSIKIPASDFDTVPKEDQDSYASSATDVICLSKSSD